MEATKTKNDLPMIIALFIAVFMAFIGTSSINIALTSFMKEFNSDLSTVNWTLTGFMLAAGVVAPITGFLGQKFSSKRVCFYAILGFTFSSLLCGIAWSSLSLVIFRVLQGITSGLIAPVSMTLIYETIHKEKQPLAISLWSLGAMLAPAVGPTLSGWLIQISSWRWIFYINIPLGIISAILIQAFVPYYKMGEKKTFDLFGFITSIGASLLLLIAFSQSSKWGWGSTKTLVSIALGLIFLVVFIVLELRSKDPMLNLRIFKYGRYTMSIIVTSIVTIALYSGSLLTPLFLQNVQQMSPLDAGLILLPASLATALVMPFVGVIYNRVGPKVLILSGVVLIALGSWRLSFLTIDSSAGFIIFWMTVRAIGISLSIIPATNAGMEVLPREESSHASAMNNWVRQALGSLSLGIFASMLMTNAASYELELSVSNASDPLIPLKAFALSVNHIFAVSTIIVLVALPMGFILRHKNVPEQNIELENRIG